MITNLILLVLIQKPFIIVTQNEDLVRVYRTKRVEIFVMTMGDYLRQFWPGDQFFILNSFNLYHRVRCRKPKFQK